MEMSAVSLVVAWRMPAMASSWLTQPPPTAKVLKLQFLEEAFGAVTLQPLASGLVPAVKCSARR